MYNILLRINDLINHANSIIKFIYPIAVLFFLGTITSAIVSIKSNIMSMRYYIEDDTHVLHSIDNKVTEESISDMLIDIKVIKSILQDIKS